MLTWPTEKLPAVECGLWDQECGSRTSRRLNMSIGMEERSQTVHWAEVGKAVIDRDKSADYSRFVCSVQISPLPRNDSGPFGFVTTVYSYAKVHLHARIVSHAKYFCVSAFPAINYIWYFIYDFHFVRWTENNWCSYVVPNDRVVADGMFVNDSRYFLLLFRPVNL